MLIGMVSSYLGASDLTRACMKEKEVSLATNFSPVLLLQYFCRRSEFEVLRDYLCDFLHYC